MTSKTGADEMAEYKLTRPEIAKILGKSTNAIRMSQRQGNKLGLEYRKGPNGYLFKFPKDQEGNHVPTRYVNHPLNHPEQRSNGPEHTLGETPKAYTGRSNNYTKSKPKVYNRGNTHKGIDNYPNLAFKMSNEAKIMASINKKFKSEEHKKAFLKMTDEAMEVAYKNSIKEEQQTFKKEAPKMFTNHGQDPALNKYGGPLNARGLQNIDNKEHRRLARKDDDVNGIRMQEKYMDQVQLDGSVKRQLTRTNVPDFSERSSNSGSYFVGHAKYDDFSNKYDERREDVAVEFSQYDLDRYGETEKPVFEGRNKFVREAIYEAKKGKKYY